MTWWSSAPALPGWPPRCSRLWTGPAVTPLIAAAQALGCGTQVGAGMFAAVCQHMVDFLLADGPLATGPRVSVA